MSARRRPARTSYRFSLVAKAKWPEVHGNDRTVVQVGIVSVHGGGPVRVAARKFAEDVMYCSAMSSRFRMKETGWKVNYGVIDHDDADVYYGLADR